MASNILYFPIPENLILKKRTRFYRKKDWTNMPRPVSKKTFLKKLPCSDTTKTNKCTDRNNPFFWPQPIQAQKPAKNANGEKRTESVLKFLAPEKVSPKRHSLKRLSKYSRWKEIKTWSWNRSEERRVGEECRSR